MYIYIYIYIYISCCIICKTSSIEKLCNRTMNDEQNGTLLYSHSRYLPRLPLSAFERLPFLIFYSYEVRPYPCVWPHSRTYISTDRYNEWTDLLVYRRQSPTNFT